MQRIILGCLKYCLVALLLMPFGLAQAQVYKCIQADGVVRYSDRGCSAQQALESAGEVTMVTQLRDTSRALKTATGEINTLSRWRCC